MKLLCICHPAAYRRPGLEVPVFYQRLAQDPRVELFHVPVSQVVANPIQASVAPVTAPLSYEAFLALDAQAQTRISLSEVDLVFCRTLKPFPPGYLKRLYTWTHQTSIVNDPMGIQTQIHPTFLSKVAGDLIPETMVTDDPAAAAAFLKTHGVMVAKRSNSCGGRGVFKIWTQDQGVMVDNLVTGPQQLQTLEQVMAAIQAEPTELLQLMRYLPTVDAGDKRILVVDGEIYGAYLRKSRSGHWVNNVSGDGDCTLATVTAAERSVIAQTVGYYRNLGLHTLGYDFLMNEDGNWCISEINAGNIGGFARMETLTGEPVCERLTTWLIQFAERNPALMGRHASAPRDRS